METNAEFVARLIAETQDELAEVDNVVERPFSVVALRARLGTLLEVQTNLRV